VLRSTRVVAEQRWYWRQVENTRACVIWYLCVRPTTERLRSSKRSRRPYLSSVHEKNRFYSFFLFTSLLPVDTSPPPVSRATQIYYIYNYTRCVIIYRPSIIASCQNRIRTHIIYYTHRQTERKSKKKRSKRAILWVRLRHIL